MNFDERTCIYSTFLTNSLTDTAPVLNTDSKPL